MKFELAAIAVILWLLLSLVTSCQNRSRPFQDSMKRWREHREQKRQVEPKPIDDPDNEPDPNRQRERRRIFPREAEECET